MHETHFIAASITATNNYKYRLAVELSARKRIKVGEGWRLKRSMQEGFLKENSERCETERSRVTFVRVWANEKTFGKRENPRGGCFPRRRRESVSKRFHAENSSAI